MPYPDDFNSAAFAHTHVEGRAGLAYENAVEREWNDLLWNILNDYKPEGQQLTAGQRFIDGLVHEQELDGTLYAALQAAAKHLKDRSSVTSEQIGQTLIAALSKDLSALADRNASDAE